MAETMYDQSRKPVEGVLLICSNGSASLNKMSTMPIYGKITLKNFQNQESFKAES